MSIDELNGWIRTKDPRALAMLVDHGGCECDSRGHSPFDVAIEFDNRDVIEWLSARKHTWNFCAPADPSLLGPIRHTLASTAPIVNLAAVETALRASFGPDLPFQRSPLLQACRVGHAFAIECLLAAGAKPGGKDLMGLSEAELCLLSGGIGHLTAFQDACRRHRRKLVLPEGVIEAVLGEPATLADLARGAELSAGARRLLLACACARLDTALVAAVLADTTDVNACVSKHAHPIYEACTSRLVWLHETPDHLDYAGRFARSAGPAGAQALRLDPHAPESMAVQLERAKDLQRARQAALDAWQPSPEVLARQTATRIGIVDQLLAAGLDPQKARKKAPDFWSRDLLALRDIELLRALHSRGFDLQPEAHEEEWLAPDLRALLQAVTATAITGHRATGHLALGDAPAIWHIDGETSVLALAEPTGSDGCVLLRATVHHSYGPLKDCQLELNQPDARDGTTHWQQLDRVEQLIEIEGELQPWSSEDVPEVCDETPWSATFEMRVNVPSEESRLCLRLNGPEGPSPMLDSVSIAELRTPVGQAVAD